MLDENIEKSSTEESTDKIGKGTEDIKNVEVFEEKKAEVKDVIEETEITEKESEEKETKPEAVDKDIEVEVTESKKDSEEVNIKDEVEDSKEENTSVPPEKEDKKIPVIDYVNLSLEELVAAMQKLDNFPIQEIKQQFEALKSDFTKKFSAFLGEKKEEFIKEGGNEIDFSFFSPVKTKFNDLIKEYKKKRQKHYNDIEKEQKDNLQKKLQLIDDLKDLIDNAEPSTMYKNFRSIQDEWRKIGQIPHTKHNDVWRTYQHHVERFYDLLHLNNDFRDLDFKHNLEEKTKLAEKVEELAQQEDVNHAFKELQVIHRMWKEDIGPVARDVRDEIWDRFSEATKKIHDKRHEFQDQLDAKFKENVELKLVVIEKIKSFRIENDTSHKAWQEGIKNMEKLRNEFFAIGRVPRSKNEEIWQLFKDATKQFNKSKNTFYKSIKKDQLDNLTKKMHLVEQAESLKDSDDWDTVTDIFKKIQNEWKNIGHVPRKDSDKIWKRFKDACNYYFEQFHNMQDGSNKEQVEVFNKKKEVLEQFKELIDQENAITLEVINTYISDWKAIGVVPMKMRHVETKFNKAIDAACKKINMGKDETELLKFKNTIDTYLEQNNVRKIDSEMLFVRRKVDEITKEIKQLENNISFVSNASRDNPLVKNVYNNIEKHNENLKIWQQKLSYLKQLDY